MSSQSQWKNECREHRDKLLEMGRKQSEDKNCIPMQLFKLLQRYLQEKCFRKAQAAHFASALYLK